MSSVSDMVTICGKLVGLKKAHELPSLEKVELGGIPPEAIATTKDIKALLTGNGIQDLDATRYLNDDMHNGWCHELRLRLWLKNKSSMPLNVVGISPNKSVIDYNYRSAVVFPPQGGIAGEVLRFECNLDTEAPSMRRFQLNGSQRIYTSSEYYFDEGTLQIEPNHLLCLSLHFRAEKKAYEISPELIIMLNSSTKSMEVPLSRKAIVCPSELIPDDAKYVRNYSPEPPYIKKDPERFSGYLQ